VADRTISTLNNNVFISRSLHGTETISQKKMNSHSSDQAVTPRSQQPAQVQDDPAADDLERSGSGKVEA